MSLPLRIFLASPGDVADERALALRVLEDLQYDPLLRGRITVETVAWDKPGAGAPMLATMTPQEAIKRGLPTPAECDIVIVIFWSRMGTPLPPEWKKPDGRGYLSGTEWEYLNALEAAERQGRPAVLVYRRTAVIALNPTDPDVDKELQQWRLVQQFFQSFENPDGSLRRGYNPYPAPEAFREQLNLHLRALVRELLEQEGPVAAAPPVAPAPAATAPPLWPGSPFPGLRAFTPADAPIFFGRGRETDGLLHRLADPLVRFLAVVGASGSGKSSLVAAGLIPRLLAGAITGSQDWVWVRFTPGEVSDNPFMALALRFNGTFQQSGQSPRELAELLRTGSYPLAAPGPGALHEMITRPAERAGLTFEEGLAERILDDTGAEPGALALLAFALEELYRARTTAGLLTQAAYDGFHGVQGAIAQRADAVCSTSCRRSRKRP